MYKYTYVKYENFKMTVTHFKIKISIKVYEIILLPWNRMEKIDAGMTFAYGKQRTKCSVENVAFAKIITV